VNCAAFPRDLIASELFGHERGAFTGALSGAWPVELADGGTISWTKLANCHQRCRSRCCGFSRSGIQRVGAGSRSMWTFGSSPHQSRLELRSSEGAFREDFYRSMYFRSNAGVARRQDDFPRVGGVSSGATLGRPGKTSGASASRTLNQLRAYHGQESTRAAEGTV